MIRHVVFFTAGHERDLQTIHDGLSLLKGIPDCLHLEVAANRRDDDIPGIRPDFIVYGEFASDEQLAAFKRHALYQRSIDVVRPLRDQRIAADFDADRDAG